jgi:hypothetical protein
MNSSSFLTDSTHLGTPCSGLALSLERQPRYLYLLCRHRRTPARRRSKMARKLIVVRTTLLKFLFWLRRSSLSLRRVNFVMFRKLDFATSNALQKTSPVHLQMTLLLEISQDATLANSPHERKEKCGPNGEPAPDRPAPHVRSPIL